MKKWTIVGLTTLLTLAASAALASVPQKSLYLGGIGIGSEGSYVRQIYGAPTETEREHSASHPSGSVVEYEYGDGVSLHLAEGVVYQVEVSANNGWATPEGIHVGMDASLLEGTYGKPDMVRGDKIIYRAEGLSGVGLIFEIEKGKNRRNRNRPHPTVTNIVWPRDVAEAMSLAFLTDWKKKGR